MPFVLFFFGRCPFFFWFVFVVLLLCWAFCAGLVGGGWLVLGGDGAGDGFRGRGYGYPSRVKIQTYVRIGVL